MATRRRTKLKSKSRRTAAQGKSLYNRLHLWATGFAVMTGLVILSLLLIAPSKKDDQAPLSLEPRTKAVKLVLPETKRLEKPQDPWKEFQAAHVTVGGPRIAIVIDDMGMDWDGVRKAASLPAAITLAFLPYAPELPMKAQMARDYGHELLVHLPMEPKGEGYDPGPMVLKTSLSQAELERRIAWNLGRFSGYVGINNHMGSAFTEDADAMRLLFRRLKSQGLMFLDSRTTAVSQGAQLAVQTQVPYAERDVFLDNAREATAVEQQLKLTEAKALRNGSAVAIGHPHDVTLEALRLWARDASERGFILVPISQIVEERGTPLWRMALENSATRGPSGAR